MRLSLLSRTKRSALDGLLLSLFTTTICATALMAVVLPQKLAQKTATEGVMTVYLSRTGELRLWNQPVSPNHLLPLLERGVARSQPGGQAIVRLIPEAEVPWGVIQTMVRHLQPSSSGSSWILQLQVP
jgi:hypothetical protein